MYDLEPVVAKLQELASQCGDRLTLVVESGGGDVAAGWFFLHDIAELQLHTHVRGQAGSMAVPLFLAGDRRTMSSDATLFVHNILQVFGDGARDAAELRAIADDLDRSDQKCAAFVAERTGLTVEAVLTLMESDTTLTATEAVRLGFAHAIEEN